MQTTRHVDSTRLVFTRMLTIKKGCTQNVQHKTDFCVP